MGAVPPAIAYGAGNVKLKAGGAPSPGMLGTGGAESLVGVASHCQGGSSVGCALLARPRTVRWRNIVSTQNQNDGQRSGPLAAVEICRGVARLLRAHGLAVVTELTLANGRRADVAGVTAAGEIWIVEVKSCLADLRSDQKWPEYRDYCDRLFFAVAPNFPQAALPSGTGLIIADRYGGEIARTAPDHKLAGARRKAMTLRMLRAAAFRLHAAIDPDGVLGET